MYKKNLLLIYLNPFSLALFLPAVSREVQLEQKIILQDRMPYKFFIPVK